MNDINIEEMFESIIEKISVNRNIYNKFLKFFINYNNNNINNKTIDLEKGYTSQGEPYYIIINNNERINATKWLCDNE